MAFGVDNKIMLQVVFLSMLEDDKMTIHEVLDLAKRSAGDVWHGLNQERHEFKGKSL